VHHVPVAQTVKQTVQLFRKKCTQRREDYQLSVTLGETYQKIEGSVKPINETDA
jgi:hypothetical protein